MMPGWPRLSGPRPSSATPRKRISSSNGAMIAPVTRWSRRPEASPVAGNGLSGTTLNRVDQDGRRRPTVTPMTGTAKAAPQARSANGLARRPAEPHLRPAQRASPHDRAAGSTRRRSRAVRSRRR